MKTLEEIQALFKDFESDIYGDGTVLIVRWTENDPDDQRIKIWIKGNCYCLVRDDVVNDDILDVVVENVWEDFVSELNINYLHY